MDVVRKIVGANWERVAWGHSWAFRGDSIIKSLENNIFVENIKVLKQHVTL